MTISAKIIADSISPQDVRLPSILARYPRFIHAELMTHRVLSRNASSSRAIPVERLIEDILRDTAMPIHWGKNQPGMQAHEEHFAEVGLPYTVTDNQGFSVTRNEAYSSEEAWCEARDKAIEVARAFHRAGYHKQIVNRLLEPYSHINVLITATEWNNFMALRDHPDAQPEIRELAVRIKEALAASTPKLLQPGQWHLPFVSDEEAAAQDYSDNPIPYQVRLSVARCARTSYLTHDGKKPEIAADLALYDRLVGSEPLHASPAEHQATPDEFMMGPPTVGYRQPRLHGNLRGWIQYRKTLPNENQA